MEALFSTNEFSSRSAPVSLVAKCESCRLYRNCQSPKMPVVGKGKQRVLIVDEAPGEIEDRRGKHLVGRAGQLLEETLERLNVDMRVDCYIDQSIRCRATAKNGKNRPPSPKELAACYPNLLSTIKEKEPHVIVTLGHPTLTSVLSGMWREKIGPLTRWLGWQIPSQIHNTWICPVWHPKYVLQYEEKNDYRVVEKIWMRHLRKAFKLEGKPWDKLPDYDAEIQVIVDPDEAADKIIRIIKDKPRRCAFDFETNMLKPEHVRSRIVSCSISDGDTTISYPWFGNAIQATKEFLKSKIKKVASNFKFEQRWTKRILGFDVRNWDWCTMTGAHWIDNRTGICSVKFQAFVLLGFPIYDSEVKPYLKSVQRGGYAPNRVDELELFSLLHYGGLDSLLEYKVAEKQESYYERAIG